MLNSFMCTRESESEFFLVEEEEEVQERDLGPPAEVVAAMADMQVREDLPKPSGEDLMEEFICPITQVTCLHMPLPENAPTTWLAFSQRTP